MEHCKKLYCWDIYGVRQFPYRGRRKYSPGLYQTFNGSIIIENDVFGLTIFQFEREYKACLSRRKQHEQRILNIRYPDKINQEYIEYLKYGDDTVEDCITIVDETLSEKHHTNLYLTQVAGTEIEIRTRQRMFNVMDKIENRISDEFKSILSGSLAEGIDLPGSDVDNMYELPEVTVIDSLKHVYASIGNTTLLMEHDVRYPGFCKLQFVAEGYNMQGFIRSSLKDAHSGVYLSTERFVHFFGTVHCLKSFSRHGPAMSDVNQFCDVVFCFRSQYWPTYAMNWIHRRRTGQWPMKNVIDIIVNEGCLLVPIGPKNEYNDLLWRISFSMAEKRLSHSMNFTQLLCYILLKLTLKKIINRNEDVKDLICSYFLKTTVFWLSEEICIDTFKITNLSYCFSMCIDKLMSFVRNCYCPNYFIPQHNMFIGKVDESNNTFLLSILGELRNTELKVIIDQIFGNNFINHSVCTMTDTNMLSVNLECLFFRVIPTVSVKDIDSGYKVLQYINLLMESESSEFILGVLRYYHAMINQQISQRLVLPENRRKRNNIVQRFYKPLMDGTQSDAVTGWLLYASFYYVLGQYNKTLQMVDDVLSRCTPDMLMLTLGLYTTEAKNTYQHKTERYLTLNQKMKQATMRSVFYIKQSTLIPQELQLEVQDLCLLVPPVVMCHCLQFLSYHHLGHVNNKQLALRKLHLTIRDGYFVAHDELSDSLVILGVCYEIAGDRDTAYYYYNEALRCKGYVCCSAKQRSDNLFST